MKLDGGRPILFYLILIGSAISIIFVVGCTEERNPQRDGGKLLMRSGYEGMIEDWEAFLSCWEREAMAQLAQEEAPLYFEKIAAERASVSYPPASEADIQAAQERLGVALPPSYRHFLSASNGWLLSQARFNSSSEIGWVPGKEPFLMQMHGSDLSASPEEQVPDKNYYVYWADEQSGQDPVHMRSAYFSRLLSIAEQDGGQYYLLNPEVVFEDGEWEAWMYEPAGGGGALRYRSFAELMRNEYYGAVKQPLYGGFYAEDLLKGTCADLLPAPLPQPPGRLR